MSFENAVYNNGVFNNFTAWTEMNKKYGTTNITYIIRQVELLGHDTYEPIRFSIMISEMNEYSFWISKYFENLNVAFKKLTTHMQHEKKCF